MALVAKIASTGTEVESFSTSPDVWNSMRKAAAGTYIMVGSNWPAVLKRSIHGLQFFAHAPGYMGPKPTPESEEHRRTKVQVAVALRAAG